MEKQERQSTLLQAIIQEYIKTARPVGSHTLVDEYGFDYSPATIRNDMAALERAGLITQPHTSAGRIPTEKGYQFYIQNFLQQRTVEQRKRHSMEQVFVQRINDAEELLKQAARTLADVTDEAVVMSLDSGDTYYTGISHMLRKPEFAQTSSMVSIGEAFDHLDEVMNTMGEQLDDEVQIFIGQQNPFSRDCALILTEYTFGRTHVRGMIGIIGPMRMDYEKNIAILEYMESLMDDTHDTQRR